MHAFGRQIPSVGNQTTRFRIPETRAFGKCICRNGRSCRPNSWAGYKRLKLVTGKLHVHKMKTVMVLLLTNVFLHNSLESKCFNLSTNSLSCFKKWLQESPEELSFLKETVFSLAAGFLSWVEGRLRHVRHPCVVL